MFGNGNKDSAWYEKIDRGVATIKEFLHTRIGTTFVQATSPSNTNLMGDGPRFVEMVRNTLGQD